MMNLFQKLLLTGATLFTLSGCGSSPKPINFEQQYGELLVMNIKSPWLFLLYDKNRDGKRDSMFIYEIIEKKTNFFYLRLDEIWEDKNENGKFEDNEKRKLSGEIYMPIIPYSNQASATKKSL